MNNGLAIFCAVVIMLSVYMGIGLAVAAIFRKLDNKGYLIVDMLMLDDCNDVSELALMAMFWPILVVAVTFISAALLIVLPFWIMYLLFLKAAKAVFK